MGFLEAMGKAFLDMIYIQKLSIGYDYRTDNQLICTFRNKINSSVI